MEEHYTPEWLNYTAIGLIIVLFVCWHLFGHLVDAPSAQLGAPVPTLMPTPALAVPSVYTAQPQLVRGDTSITIVTNTTNIYSDDDTYVCISLSCP